MSFSSLAFVITLVSAIVALGLAAFVLHCNRRASANQWLALGLFVISLHQTIALVSSMTSSAPWHGALLRLTFGISAAIPPIWLAFSLTFGERNGILRTSRWYPILLSVAFVSFGGAIPLLRGLGVQLIANERTGAMLVGLDGWGLLLCSAYLVGLILVLLHLENLYRCAIPPVRHTLRPLVLGIFVAFGCQIAATSYTLLFRVIHPSHFLVSAAGFLGGQALIAFALVRHGLLDSNLYVSRYVVYRSLPLALAGGYLFSLGLVAEILQLFGISLDFLTGTLLAVAGGAALALLLFSANVRWKAKSFIQAHFYRHKYDYREEWMEFTRHLSHATTVRDVAAQTADRILKGMWVRQVAIYVTGAQPEIMNLLHQIGYDHLPSTLTVSSKALRILSGGGNQMPSLGRMDDTSENRADLMRNLSPDVSTGHVVPLVALDAPVGLLLVGPEMSGKPFEVDDRDLLAAVAAQAGAMINSARLSQDAAEGRELQILARLSTFVTHDLKNSVSMLSMLAENAPQHMHKPAFQADAVRTFSEVTAKMRTLLATLTAPSRQTASATQRFHLASAVEAWTRAFADQVPSRIRLELATTGALDVNVDPDQLRSVLSNLTLNAIEAISGEGFIHISTTDEPGTAVLCISDTGRGMPPEFIRERLFRPFQTTKPNGLGVGLYQCRHMVQGWNGTMTVESQEGQGTQIVVRLPGVSNRGAMESVPPPTLASIICEQDSRNLRE